METGSMKKSTYKAIFFDLDHTLWDYECNAEETLKELFLHYQLEEKGIPGSGAFFKKFVEVNNALWHLYDHGKIDSEKVRIERFKQILTPFGAYDPELSDCLSRDYLDWCPQKKKLIPNALEVLEYLSDKYSLTIVTNGFEEIQHTKLSSGNLRGYFDHVVTSQYAGHRKPSKEIFQTALNKNAVFQHEALMVGDNLITDIAGAHNAEMDAVYFNPSKINHDVVVKYEISDLLELITLL